MDQERVMRPLPGGAGGPHRNAFPPSGLGTAPCRSSLQPRAAAAAWSLAPGPAHTFLCAYRLPRSRPEDAATASPETRCVTPGPRSPGCSTQAQMSGATPKVIMNSGLKLL